jgi:hypothetical protein
MKLSNRIWNFKPKYETVFLHLNMCTLVTYFQNDNLGKKIRTMARNCCRPANTYDNIYLCVHIYVCSRKLTFFSPNFLQVIVSLPRAGQSQTGRKASQGLDDAEQHFWLFSELLPRLMQLDLITFVGQRPMTALICY